MRLLIARCLLVPGLLASGAAMAGTNFPPLADYPSPTCAKVEKPVDVPPMKIGEDPVAYNKKIRQHNEQVAQYNATLHEFAACMKAYVANAQADMDLIRDRVNKSVTAANEAQSGN